MTPELFCSETRSPEGDNPGLKSGGATIIETLDEIFHIVRIVDVPAIKRY